MIISQYIKARLQYRADFVISSIGMFFRDVAGIIGLWIIFKSIPLLSGWNYFELLFIYAFSMLSMAPLQLCFDNVWRLRFHIIDGSFIKYYLRPLNTLFYYLSEIFDIKGFSQLVIAIVVLIYSSIKLQITWTVGKVLLSILLLFTSSLVMSSLMLMAATTAFWIKNSFAVLDFTFQLRDFTRYPLTIMNGFFKFLFTFVIPIGFVAYYPVKLILRPYETSMYVFISPVIGVVLFILAYLFWRKGVRSYNCTGT